jgi:phage baseplate assembly protein W
MAAINIDILSKRRPDRPIYTDLMLDLESNYTLDPKLEAKDTIKDLEVSNDIAAIKNSLFNLFTTIPGQKILNPIYGLNILQFLFTGISDDNARAMGNVILRGIQKYEPRVEVVKIYVMADIENQTYEIGLKLNVPTLNIEGLALKGTLSESGFYIN